MTLDKLRPMAGVIVDPSVRLARAANLTANGVSVLALGFAAFAGISFAATDLGPIRYLVGAAFVLANGWCDLIDGALARERGSASRAGDFLDHVFDRYADIVIVTGLAAGVGAWMLGFFAVTGVLMTSYLGTQAIAVDLDRVYAGVLGRADRLVLIVATSILMVGLPDPVGGLTLVEWLLVLLGGVGHLTAVQRFVGARRGLSE